MKRIFHILIQTFVGIVTGTAFWGLLAGLFFLALGPAEGDLAVMMKTFLSIFVLILGAVHGASIGLVTGLLNIRKILIGALVAVLATFLMVAVYSFWQAANAGGSFPDVLFNLIGSILRGTLVLAVPAVIIGMITVLISRLFFKDTAVSKP